MIGRDKKKLYRDMSAVEQSNVDLQFENKLRFIKRRATIDMNHYDNLPRKERDRLKTHQLWELTE